MSGTFQANHDAAVADVAISGSKQKSALPSSSRVEAAVDMSRCHTSD